MLIITNRSKDGLELEETPRILLGINPQDLLRLLREGQIQAEALDLEVQVTLAESDAQMVRRFREHTTCEICVEGGADTAAFLKQQEEEALRAKSTHLTREELARAASAASRLLQAVLPHGSIVLVAVLKNGDAGPMRGVPHFNHTEGLTPELLREMVACVNKQIEKMESHA